MSPAITSSWLQYERRELIEARPYVEGETLDGITVTDEVRELTPLAGGYVARDPREHNNQWFVPKVFFEQMYADPLGAVTRDTVPLFKDIQAESTIKEFLYAGMMQLFQIGDSALTGTMTVDGNRFDWRLEVTDVTLPQGQNPNIKH